MPPFSCQPVLLRQLELSFDGFERYALDVYIDPMGRIQRA